MIPLIKIRLTYIKRHPCKCFFNYFAAATLLFFYFILYVIFSNTKRYLQQDKDFDPKYLYEYPSNKDYLPDFWIKNIGIITENETLFNVLKKIAIM